MIKLKLISNILCIAFSALTIVAYGKIAPLSVQGQSTASSRTQLFDIISGIFKNDYHESTIGMEESKTPKQRIRGSISYILSDSGKCCEPSNPPTFSTPSKLPDHENCSENEECESDRCEKTPTCNFIACCIPETGLNNGSRCNSKDQCLSDYCNESNVCSEKRPINSGCQADGDCVSGLVCSDQFCKIGVGETCEDHNECETGRCSKEKKCKVKEIVGATCEQNVDCDIDICSDNICGLGVGDACENKNECVSNICSDNKCKMIVGANCEQNVDCDSGICSDNICKLGVSLRPPQVSDDSKFPDTCDMTRGVALLSAPYMSNYEGRVFLYVDGELKRMIVPETENSKYLGNYLAIDDYIVLYNTEGLEVYDRNGDYQKSFNRLTDPATAGDLFAGVKYGDPYKFQVHKISTGTKVFEVEGSWGRVAMTTEHLVVSQDGKILIYSIKSNSQSTLVGEISFPDIHNYYLLFDIHKDRIAVAYHSDSGGFGAIYDTTGALQVSLEIDNTDEVLKQSFAMIDSSRMNIALNDKYVIVGAPRRLTGNAIAGAVYVFDAVTGEALEKKRSLNPQEGDRYGACVALSDNYMIATSPGNPHQDITPEAYFQTVISTSNEIYTNATSGIDEIITAEY